MILKVYDENSKLLLGLDIEKMLDKKMITKKQIEHLEKEKTKISFEEYYRHIFNIIKIASATFANKNHTPETFLDKEMETNSFFFYELRGV